MPALKVNEMQKSEDLRAKEIFARLKKEYTQIKPALNIHRLFNC